MEWQSSEYTLLTYVTMHWMFFRDTTLAKKSLGGYTRSKF